MFRAPPVPMSRAPPSASTSTRGLGVPGIGWGQLPCSTSPPPHKPMEMLYDHSHTHCWLVCQAWGYVGDERVHYILKPGPRRLPKKRTLLRHDLPLAGVYEKPRVPNQQNKESYTIFKMLEERDREWQPLDATEVRWYPLHSWCATGTTYNVRSGFRIFLREGSQLLKWQC